MARQPLPEGHVRKLIEFDAETWQAIALLARDSMTSLQELADEAFDDLLRKHKRPATLRDALRQSAGSVPKAPKPFPRGRSGPSRR